MSVAPQDTAGTAVSFGSLLASIPLSAINDLLTAVALCLSIAAGYYTVRRARRREREDRDGPGRS